MDIAHCVLKESCEGVDKEGVKSRLVTRLMSAVGLGLLSLCVVGGDQVRAEGSFFGGDIAYHTGPADNSHIRQFTYGAAFQAETEGRMRFALGVSVRRGVLEITLNEAPYSIISLGLQLRAGWVLDPFPDNHMKPIFGAYGLGGSELVTSSAPPADTSESQMSLGFGYEGEAGIALRMGRKYLRMTGVYRKFGFNYGGERIVAAAFMGRVGFEF